MTDGPGPRDAALQPVRSMYPRWHCWVGISGLLYGRLPGSSPPIVVRGEDSQDLADEIKRAESKLRDPW
jgi:hypothetical protein